MRRLPVSSGVGYEYDSIYRITTLNKRSNKMTDIELTEKILGAMIFNASDVKNAENFGGTNITQLAKQLSVPRAILLDKLRELEAENRLLVDNDCEFAHIDDTGRQLYADLKYNVSNPQITVHGSVHNSTLVQGNNATINITNNFFQALEREIESSALSPEEQKTWLTRIKDFSSHPIVVEIVSKVLGGLCKL